MKYIIGIILPAIIYSCSVKNDENEFESNLFRDISFIFSKDNFEDLHTFILENGDTETYCSMYNDNPHFSLEGFDVYLNPEIGQSNINCDPEISKFNVLVIRDWDAEPQYYHMLLVRKGDLDNELILISIPEGVREEKVYLLNYKESDLDSLENKVQNYLSEIKNLLNGH